MPPKSLLECKHCTARACQPCLKQFTGGNANNGRYKCTICHKVDICNDPNKLYVRFMEKVIKFECSECNRYWGFEDFQNHKIRGNCRKDPYASNQVELLNKDQQAISWDTKQEMQKISNVNQDRPDVEMEDVELPALEYVYLCEKDTKQVCIYNLLKDEVERRPIDMDTNFQTNFNYCQTVNNRLFVVGGGDFR